jgi:hypothetical protein
LPTFSLLQVYGKVVISGILMTDRGDSQRGVSLMDAIISNRKWKILFTACRRKPENPYMEWTRFETNYMTDA